MYSCNSLLLRVPKEKSQLSLFSFFLLKHLSKHPVCESMHTHTCIHITAHINTHMHGYAYTRIQTPPYPTKRKKITNQWNKKQS
jgi:hypothetical protein